ncbi:hypothetical protein Nepgr_017066 [Nepenthes gracilis]|uniref:Uncharacterized protein n=1 Tax=Nepenthes gracilis TaxID=150966 RepID=A0AAD3XT23_NEPGR|nr:hypothetical protein Nepgr_017066 [Nepenthes gracilis]
MKERGKELEAYGNGGNCIEENFSASDFPCERHPSSISAGICAYCLRDRLMELVCPECGEQRLSSCSCSEISSNPNSCGTAEIGSVGRISFLIENEKGEALHQISNPKPQQKAEAEVVYLKRSNSSCVDVKNRNGFWKIVKIFSRKREKCGINCEKNDDKSEIWASDCLGVSRSRSLCSFRGAGLYDTEENGGLVVSSAARASSVSGGLTMESAKRSCFSESEARISNFGSEKDVSALPIASSTKNFFSLKESQFSCDDDPGFIDLKLELSSESKPELSALKRGGELLGNESGASFGKNNMSERELRKYRKSHKVWRWFYRRKSKLGEL